MPRERIQILFFIILSGLLVATAVSPYDRATWVMEVAPVLIVLPILVLTFRRFPLTPLLYVLIFFHAIILITGGAYIYARVPLGFWVQDLLHLSRNNYDRLGHFFQGLVPSLLAREILLRLGYISNRRMVTFLAICFAMAVSAWYELIEWAAAVVLGQKADDSWAPRGAPGIRNGTFSCALSALSLPWSD